MQVYLLDIMELSQYFDNWWANGAGIFAALIIWLGRTKSVINFFSKAYESCKRFFTFQRILTERMDKQDKELAFIRGELTFNGGGSTKDFAKNSYELAVISNMRTKHIIMINPIPMYECDKEGHCILANTALCELFGLSEQEILGNGWLSAIAPEDRQACWENYQNSIKSDIPYEWVYTVVNYKTHQRTRCKTEMTVLRDVKGKPVLFQGYVEPISSQKQ